MRDVTRAVPVTWLRSCIAPFPPSRYPPSGRAWAPTVAGANARLQTLRRLSPSHGSRPGLAPAGRCGPLLAPTRGSAVSDPKKRPRIGLFVTCLVDIFRPSVGLAAVKLLEAAGCEVAVPDGQTCCGQPAYNSG